MVDAHALGACGLGRAGSTPASPTRVAVDSGVSCDRNNPSAALVVHCCTAGCWTKVGIAVVAV